MRELTVTMPLGLYQALLNGRKRNTDQGISAIRGLGSHEKVVEYVNATWGLLGKVVEVIPE